MRITEKALANLEQIKNEIPIWIRDAIFENAELIINILQDNQLSKGKDSSGTIVGKYSWTTDYFYNKGQNKARQPKTKGEAYNFEWHGEFFDSMNIKVNSVEQGFDIFSSTGKDKFLEKTFRTELTKLTKENNDWVNKNIIEPYISKKIMENILKF